MRLGSPPRMVDTPDWFLEKGGMADSSKEKKKPTLPNRYDDTFRRSVVERWAASGKTGGVVAQEVGIKV